MKQPVNLFVVCEIVRLFKCSIVSACADSAGATFEHPDWERDLFVFNDSEKGGVIVEPSPISIDDHYMLAGIASCANYQLIESEGE